MYRHALPPGFVLKKDRKKEEKETISLEEFVAAHDKRLFETGADLTRLIEVAHTTVVNRFEGLNGLHAHLDQANLLDEERLRPGWDMYFMVSARCVSSGRRGCGTLGLSALWPLAASALCVDRPGQERTSYSLRQS